MYAHAAAGGLWWSITHLLASTPLGALGPVQEGRADGIQLHGATTEGIALHAKHKRNALDG